MDPKHRKEWEVPLSSQTPEKTLNLPIQATIFTAELTAIKLALNKANTLVNNSTIFSDSRSAVEAIHRHNNNHPIVVDIYEMLIRLTSNNKTVKFCWSPSQVNISIYKRVNVDKNKKT